MDFASKYVYETCEPEYEYVSDEEYNDGLNISDDSDEEEAEPGTAVRFGSSIKNFFTGKKKNEEKNKPTWQKESDPESPPPPQPDTNKRRFRKADSNIVSIRLNTLKDPSNMHAGDAVRCQGSGCPAILSKISKLETGMSGKNWVCEFCGSSNAVDVEEEEIPRNDDVTYLLEAAPSTKAAGPTGFDESIVVFCIDISGSMCVTTEVPGNINLRCSSAIAKSKRFNVTGEDQYLPNQKRNVTNVSRLEFMQAAVDKQLEDLTKDHPNRRVAIIAFNNEIRVIDEGVNTDQIIAGMKLENMEELDRLGAELNLPKPIKETKAALSNKVFDLEEGGATALGPSIVVAMKLASRYRGSRIIVCTDGLANVGLGRMDEGTCEEQEKFYDEMGDTAVQNGVSVSVITIKGAESKLVYLGKLADKTNGQVNSVDPLRLTEEFSNVLADRIIATNVTATFILHRKLVILEQDTEENVIVKNIGNAKLDTEITFKYGKKTVECPEIPVAAGTNPAAITSCQQAEALPLLDQSTSQLVANEPSASSTGAGDDASPADYRQPTSSQPVINEPSASSADAGDDASPAEYPFQLILEYTDTDGTKALRVLTQMREVTNSREVAERDMNVEIIGLHTAKESANLALRGEYTQSRGVALMNHRLAWRNTRDAASEKKKAYNKIFSKIRSVDQRVTQQQKSERERSKTGCSYSDEEDDEEYCDEVDTRGQKESCVVPPTLSVSKAQKKKSKRTEEVQDDMASDMYNFKQTNISNLML